MSYYSLNITSLNIVVGLKQVGGIQEAGLNEDATVAVPKIVRISITDEDATNTSSNEEEQDQQQRLTKRVINEVRIEEESEVVRVFLANNQKQKSKPLPEEKRKFWGVRQRRWGKWAAEIHDPVRKSSLGLGTFQTAEEAAMVYDRAAIQLRGHNALTNIIAPPSKILIPDHDSSSNESSSINNLSCLNASSSIDHIVVIDEYDSGKQCQSIRSPTSVLSGSDNEWRPGSKEQDETHFVKDYGYFDGVISPTKAIFFGVIELILLEEMNLVPETMLVTSNSKTQLLNLEQNLFTGGGMGVQLEGKGGVGSEGVSVEVRKAALEARE
ncbi:ethylene-responsive transcription factor WIN1 [Rosa chinensis]|uniref:ethylene-responsive transcription factor WIN1 n=1 Tax=Rosa chinensis TaxID=74649 RepID=UPI000D0886AA|nr:ethylene-responsive transcription factor WIN1 [Rosa chinensis]